jgi:hypothetical protein
MGFTCDVCSSQPATLFCFADKVSLCAACDSNLHGGAKASQKHERVALTPQQDAAQCDICQELPAVMFCSEDRAMTCRRCDLMIHTANQFTKTHHRYILSGVAAGLHGLPEPSASSASSEAETMTTVQRRSVAAMPAIQHAPSNGDLLNLPQGMVPTGATLAGAPSLGAPAPIAAGQQQRRQASASTRGGDGGAGPSGSGSGGAERHDSVTLASDLLGMPSLPQNYSAKDVDAVWGDAGLGDLDDWSKFLEVPDLGGFLPDDAAGDIFGSAGGASQPADSTIFDDPVVSVRDPARLSSSVPSPLPPHVQQPKTRLGTGSPATPRDSMVPEVPTLKRQRNF